MGRLERAAGSVARRVFPKYWLLKDNRLGEWYDRNGSYKFKRGQMLILKDNAFGFGRRPVALVDGYEEVPSIGEMYRVTMFSDKFDDEDRLLIDPRTGKPQREARAEKHFKWNIEHHFRRAPRKISVKKAVKLYDH